MTPILKWSGGKRKEIRFFESFFPENFEVFVEPFVGGGAVYFNLEHKKNIINDVHKDLINFYRQLQKNDLQKVYDIIMSYSNDEKTYYELREKIREDFEPTFERACIFFYINKTAFRGMLRYNSKGQFNIPYGKYKTTSYSEVLNPGLKELLNNTKIYNEDFEVIFNKYNDEKYFYFLDPPYDSTFVDYGYCLFDREYQERLANVFKKTSSKCMMIISKTDFIEDLYKDYIDGMYDKKYNFRIYNKRVGTEIDKAHLIIKNY